jgi:hypothetical protein
MRVPAKIVNAGQWTATLGAIAVAASQMYESNQKTERLRIEKDARATCQGQQVRDSDAYIELRERLDVCEGR